MLTRIRERATGWIAWAIVILITIPFALWGVNSYFTGGINVNVAEFDGEVIDYESYQRALYSERDRMRQAFGSSATAELLSGDVLGRQVANRLVNDVLLQRDAHERGYRISDAALAEAILNEPSFQNEQGFSRDLYERILQFSGYSPTEFESVQRSNAATQQVQTGFIESILQIDSSVDDLVQILNQRRLGEYAIVEPAGFLAEVRVTEEDIRAEYEENQSLYVDDERIKVEYIELSRSDFAVNFTPTDETLRQIYDAEAQQYREEERVRVRHIMLKSEGGDNFAALEEARDLIARIRRGEDFASLAAEHSDDFGSVEQGGSLGWINRGVTGPAFEAAAFALGEGEISDPVETVEGVHIIQVEEFQGEQIKSFEDVRDELTEQAISNQAEIEMFEIAEEMRNVAFEQPDSLEPARDLLGLRIQYSDWFGRNEGTGIASNSRVRRAAFSETVLEEGFNSDVISLDDGRQILLRKRDYRPPETLSLALVEAEITEKLLSEKSAAMARGHAEFLLDRLSDGADWTETLYEQGLEAYEIPVRTGNANDIDSAQVAAYVYAWEKPGPSGAAYGGGPISDGRFAMFRITGIAEGGEESVTMQELDNLRSIYLLRYGAGLFESYVAQLRQGIDVSFNEELLTSSSFAEYAEAESSDY